MLVVAEYQLEKATTPSSHKSNDPNKVQTVLLGASSLVDVKNNLDLPKSETFRSVGEAAGKEIAQYLDKEVCVDNW